MLEWIGAWKEEEFGHQTTQGSVNAHYIPTSAPIFKHLPYDPAAPWFLLLVSTRGKGEEKDRGKKV